MTTIDITDSALSRLRDKVVIVTGSESGIGLGAVKSLLQLGARVVGGDVEQRWASENANYLFKETDVTSWVSLRALFTACIDKHGRVDHVFANAGIGLREDFLTDEFDEHGYLEPPNHSVFDVNFRGVADTVKLGLHHIKKNELGGSIVMTASSSSYQRFPAPDYTAAKHGVLGLMRGLYYQTGSDSVMKTRINAIAPSWTLTGIVGETAGIKSGIRSQTPEAAARSALYLMADDSKHGQLVYSVQGKYTEFEEAMLSSTNALLDGADAIDPRIRNETEELHLLLQAHADTS